MDQLSKQADRNGVVRALALSSARTQGFILIENCINAVLVGLPTPVSIKKDAGSVPASFLILIP